MVSCLSVTYFIWEKFFVLFGNTVRKDNNYHVISDPYFKIKEVLFSVVKNLCCLNEPFLATGTNWLVTL